MGKIAILTLNGYFNYGNRLQNYATQEVIKTLGFDVETIINDRASLQKKPLEDRIDNLITNYKNLHSIICHKLLRIIHKDTIAKRTKIFRKFTEDYIKETTYTFSKDNVPDDLSNQYDYFITGSDQVWNPDYLHGSSIYFLTFAEKHKRIAFAPSFGVSEIKPEYVERYKEWLSGMHRLSIREDDGAKIIKELTGRDVPVLVDPTMLLSKEKWLSIAKPAESKPKGKYMLTYFLGEKPAKYKSQIRNIIKRNNLEVINLGDMREKETYKTGPSQFIDYIDSCSIVCTDSFHGTVFSILFEKPFIVYERIGSSSSMYSRIDTLLNKFDLNSRKAENIKTNNDVFDIDYSHVPPILERERKKAIDYLKEALNVKDDN